MAKLIVEVRTSNFRTSEATNNNLFKKITSKGKIGFCQDVGVRIDQNFGNA